MHIEACFDSHVHWAATGEFAQRLQLATLKSATDILQMNVQPAHRRGEWVLGFGWDDATWSDRPHSRVLDRWQPGVPVALSRSDGHALWLNGEAVRRANLMDRPDPEGGRIERDAEGRPTGIVVDRAADLVHGLIPRPSGLELRRDLLKATRVFNQAGFTHIRDMTGDETQWNEAVRLDEAGLLTIAVEEYFWVKSAADLDAVLDLAVRARQRATPNLRVRGIKIFLDGALGSEGAWLTRCYHGSDQKGLTLWEEPALRQALTRAWAADLDVAVHAIGDAATAHIVGLTTKLAQADVRGRLHVEHAELMSSETIAHMKGLDITCHLQPAHWLADRHWLNQKVGDLSLQAFPWRRLQEAEIPFDFGSDAPIAEPSLARTFQALTESAEAGVPRLLGSPTTYMRHADLSWAPNSFTRLEQHKPVEVVFRGENIL